jgi:hypothetical protein
LFASQVFQKRIANAAGGRLEALAWPLRIGRGLAARLERQTHLIGELVSESGAFLRATVYPVIEMCRDDFYLMATP